MVKLAQSERAASLQKKFNEVPVVSEAEDMISDSVVLGSRFSGETFEERLGEIDKDFARYDKREGVFLGDHLEGKIEGNKEQRTTKGDQAYSEAGGE